MNAETNGMFTIWSHRRPHKSGICWHQTMYVCSGFSNSFIWRAYYSLCGFLERKWQREAMPVWVRLIGIALWWVPRSCVCVCALRLATNRSLPSARLYYTSTSIVSTDLLLLGEEMQHNENVMGLHQNCLFCHAFFFSFHFRLILYCWPDLNSLWFFVSEKTKRWSWNGRLLLPLHSIDDHWPRSAMNSIPVW